MQGAYCPLIPHLTVSFIPLGQQEVYPPGPEAQFELPQYSPQLEAQHLNGLFGTPIPKNLTKHSSIIIRSCCD